MSDGEGSTVEETDDPLIGRVFNSRYRLESRLGEGAMGAVYKARHVKVGRPFAVKVLHNRLLNDDKLRKRFEREAELAGKLHHINVIGVVDVGETEDGIHYMVMEFAEGPTLGSLIEGAMHPARVISIVQQLCDGLQHAHEHGLIHRDFKPDNVIVERDRSGAERPRIVDFGIAILRDEASTPGRADRLTTSGLVLGTPHYMAPEHAMGVGIDHRIDLFALGVICYELLTGWLPFDGDGVDVARANLLNETPPMGVRVPNVQVDPLLEAFTHLLMQKAPHARPPTAKAARDLLDLIERDRIAAAAALGVTLPPEEIEAALALQAPAESIPVALDAEGSVPPAPPRVALPSTRAVTVPEGPRHRAEPADRALPAARSLPAGRPRWLGVAIGIAAVVAVVIAVVLVTRDGTSAPATREPAAIATAPVDAAIVAEPPLDAAMVVVAIDAGSEADSDAASAEVPAAGSAATDATVPKRDATKRPKPRPQPPVVVPEVFDTTASGVAKLYGVVGRELKALDLAKGSEASAPLWPRYLRIRINDALSDPAKRAEIHALLLTLRREIRSAR